MQVVRCFEDADIHHVSGTIDPVRDIEVINTELMLADLEVVQKRRERLAKDAKRGDKGAVAEDAVLGKIEAAINEGKPALTVKLTPEERALSAPFFLLSDKPTIFACNVKEERPRHRRHQSLRHEGARLRADAPVVRGGRHQRADRERPGRPRAGRGRRVPEGARRRRRAASAR